MIQLLDALQLVGSHSTTGDSDWCALQAVPDDAASLATGGPCILAWTIVGRDDVGNAVACTCDVQLVEVATVSGKQVVRGAALEAVTTGEGIDTKVGADATIAFRLVTISGSASSIDIYARRGA